MNNPFKDYLQHMMAKLECAVTIGATYTVGYLDNLAYENSEKEYKKIKQKADSKSKGFEMMNLQMPKNNVPEKKLKI